MPERSPIPDSAPRAGSRWRHYKGEKVRVLHVGCHTETGEALVIYSVYTGENRGVWARPLSAWDEVILVESGTRRFTPL